MHEYLGATLYYVLSEQMSFGFVSTLWVHVNEKEKKIVKYQKCNMLKNKTRGPWAFTICLRTNFPIDQSSRQI